MRCPKLTHPTHFPTTFLLFAVCYFFPNQHLTSFYFIQLSLEMLFPKQFMLTVTSSFQGFFSSTYTYIDGWTKGKELKKSEEEWGGGGSYYVHSYIFFCIIKLNGHWVVTFSDVTFTRHLFIVMCLHAMKNAMPCKKIYIKVYRIVGIKLENPEHFNFHTDRNVPWLSFLSIFFFVSFIHLLCSTQKCFKTLIVLCTIFFYSCWTFTIHMGNKT